MNLIILDLVFVMIWKNLPGRLNIDMVSRTNIPLTKIYYNSSDGTI